MHEAEIKAAVIEAMLREGTLRTSDLVASEWAVERHTRRADLAFFGRRFVGVEIKSAADTLKRLRSQVEAFARHFDEVHVVVAEKHQQKSLEIVGDAATVWAICGTNVTRIRTVRPLGGPKPEALATTLQLDELGKLCVVANGSRIPRAILEARAITLPLETLRKEVLASVNKRLVVSSTRFWDSITNRSIEREDIDLLSRFVASRRQVLPHNRAAFWADWSESVQMQCASA